MGDEKHIYIYTVWKPEWKDVCVHERIILKLTLEKFIWVRMGGGAMAGFFNTVKNLLIT
jgi:hypothetical protein